MIIIGAKGFAKEVLEIFHQKNELNKIAFYDNVSMDVPNKLYNTFPVLKNEKEVVDHFENYGNGFVLGVGNPFIRYQLCDKFILLGGNLTSVISPFARIGHYNNVIGEGVNIMTGVIITNDVYIGKCTLINLNVTIGHDVVIDKYVEISPGVNISGNCRIGSFTNIGTNSIILPKVKIGSNVIVAAGSVVTKDIPDNQMVAGVPAIFKKETPPLDAKFK